MTLKIFSMDANKYVGVQYVFINLNHVWVYEHKGFGVIEFLDSGKRVFAAFNEDGKIRKEFPVALYDIALTSDESVDALHAKKAHVTKPEPNPRKTKKQDVLKPKSKHVVSQKQLQEVRFEQEEARREKTPDELVDEWYLKNALVLNNLVDRKLEKMRRRGKFGISKLILNKKYLPKDTSLWTKVGEKILSESEFTVFDTKEFGIRLFVN